MSLQITPVETWRDRRAFVALPYGLHRRDPLWVAPLRRDVRTLLSSRRNPFFEHAVVQSFLARRNGKAVGRLSAIHNQLHNQVHGDSVGFFGLFECADDLETARALFDTAANWLRARKLEVLRGPTSLSINDEVGVLVEGFETPPVVMMPHNPRYYPALVEAAGFRGAKDLLVYQSTHDRLPERLVKGTQLLERRYGITTRSLDMRRFDEEVALIKRLYNAAWEKNWGFVPMTGHEIEHVAKQFRPVIVPELVLFAERDGAPIGFAVSLPDLNVALKRNPSGRLFPGILKVLWAARGISRLRILLLGTLPDWRGKGVDALMYRKIWEEGLHKGFHWGEAGWILEDNQPMRNALVQMGFEVYKTYRLYERPIRA